MQNETAKHEPVDYGVPVGRSFVDRLLLAIIDAHTEPSNSSASVIKMRYDRLRDAKRALFGQPHPEGRPEIADETVLRWMGSQHYADLARLGIDKVESREVTKPRSERKLVREAIVQFCLPDSSEERLRKKFSTQKDKWLEIAQMHDDVPEQLDSNLLENIRDILHRRGIAMTLDRIER